MSCDEINLEKPTAVGMKNNLPVLAEGWLPIVKNFKLRAWPRDYDYEAHYIKRSRLELRLMTTLKTSKIKEWLPGKKEGNQYRIRNGEYTLDLEYVAENTNLLFRTCDYALQDRALLSAFGKPTIPKEFKGVRHFFVRLFSFANPPKKWLVDHLYQDEDWHKSLEELDRRSTNHLALHFKVGDSISEEVKVTESDWSRSVVNMNFEKEGDEVFMPFQVKDDVLVYTVVRKEIDDKVLFLPVTSFVRTGDPTEILLYIMPEEPYPLYNANRIARDKKTPILFTNIMELLMLNRCTKDILWSGFYGDIDAVPKTDFSPLYGREVYWLMLDKCPSKDPLEKYVIARDVYMALAEHGVKFKVIKFHNQSWDASNKDGNDILTGNFDDVSILNAKEFLEEAENAGVYIPESLKPKDYGLLDGLELEKLRDTPYLIEPILREQSFMVIFADTGVGKSWASLSIGIALVHGQSVFPGKWKSAGGVHKVFYLSGEMRNGEVGERVKRLHEVYAISEENKANFILKRAPACNIVSPEDQEGIIRAIDHASREKGTPGLRVSLLIIDNLATLSNDGEYSANWDKIFRWICRLQDRGITVIAVHHSNRKGEIRGTSKISDKTDMKIHAIEGGNSDKLSIILSAEKIRSERKNSLKAFKAEINLDAPKATWTVQDVEGSIIKVKEDKQKVRKQKKTVKSKKAWTAMTDEERCEAIRKARDRGDSNSQTALNFNTSVSTISKFRKVHSLKDSDLEVENK